MEKVHLTIPKGILGGFVLLKKYEKMALEATDVCLRALKESNKSRQLQCQEHCIDLIPYYLTGIRVHIFSGNLSRNSCIYTMILKFLKKSKKRYGHTKRTPTL